MISTNRRLLARVCDTLLTSCGLEGYWTETGPAAGAVEQRAAATDALTSSQRVTLDLAWALWTGDGDLKVVDLVQDLDDEALTAFGTLLVGAAYGETGISDWLAVQEDADNPSGRSDDPPTTH